ncbi:amino acid ABC transporter permease [Actinomadura barringtoniae]|uniref:Amino acid ABC transporter permease n=1 Tax=Actinomadura barringtoniae TaxID=1427535 RepID=A0A939P6S3_9ACTN|nr:amino acid ABC transporter permease [Actinomadura barringtoniae]MBO2446606.1 amino acid ABC transporter permease [Actinomadura barringtoniae]
MTTATDTAPAVRKPRRRIGKEPSVLFDAPGPRARVRNNILTGVAVVVLLAIAYAVIARLDDRGQFEGKLWSPFTKVSTWTDFILPGLRNTLKASAVAAVLALLFGVVFGLGRMSDHAWVRVPCAVVIEFFRAIPLLLLIFFIFSGPATIADGLGREAPQVTAFQAVVIGLMLYNGSVLAEIFRAGIQSLPKGQSEAAYAIGLRKNGVMRLILVPQATTAMMPAIVSQLIVLNKDTALGYIIAYTELLNEGFKIIPANYGNLLPAAIVITVIYIAMNLALGYLASWLERRSRRSKKSAGTTMGAGGPAPAPGMTITGQTTGDTGGI